MGHNNSQKFYRDKELFSIIKDISLRNNTPMEVVEAVVFSQFECAKRKLEEYRDDPMNAPNIRFLKLGQLTARHNMVPKIRENIERAKKKKEKDQEGDKEKERKEQNNTKTKTKTKTHDSRGT